MPGDEILDLLDRWQAARAQGQPVSPEDLCRDRPELLGDLARLVDERQTMDAHPEEPADPAAPDSLTLDDNSAGAGRYRVERFLAQGGLGQVFVANDVELPRSVALKRLQERLAGSRDGRRRFVLEAEITARLEHPGVVPVYGLCRDRDGQPFYAMRLIRGETMGRAIERFHAADVPGRDPGERSLALQSLLRAFLTACQTVAYAHSRGVVHRDLKPENLMLGSYGEALVVDWGLAKWVDSPDDAPDATWPDQDQPWDETVAGTIKGSPAYMSPEQAEGRIGLVGPASDVYSLGATLYTILTGTTPFRGSSTREVLSAVRDGRITPLRRVKPNVPRPLEAICLKAMSHRPAQRYATADELAREIERWLSDEPVSADREPWPDRLRRWARRHRVIVAAVGAAVVVGVAIVAATNGALRSLAKRLDAGNVALRSALDEAERNLYARDIDLADRAWWDGQPSRAASLLEECPGGRRGWEWRYLTRRNQVGLASMKLSSPAVTVGFAEGRVVAVAAQGETVGFGKIGNARLAAISPKGDRIALVSVGKDDEVLVVEAGENPSLRKFTPGVKGSVESLAFSPDGRSLAAVVARRETLPSNSREKVSFSTEFEARLVVREVETGQEHVSGPFVGSGTPGPLVLTSGGRCFCPVSFGEFVVLFAARAGEPNVEQVWSGQGGAVVAPDGFRFASRGEANSVVVREVATGQIVATLRGHAGPIRALAFSLDGRRLATASDDRTIRVWDVAGARCLASLRGQVSPIDRLAFSADGMRLASASAGDLVVWDPSSNSEATIARNLESSHLTDLAMGADGRVLVLAGHRLGWRDAAGRSLAVVDERVDVETLASTPRGDRVAVGFRDGSVVVLDGQGQTLGPLKGHTSAITGLSFSRDGLRLVSASSDGEIRVWEPASGREVVKLRGGPVVALSPEGNLLASAGPDGVVLLDARSGSIRVRLEGAGAPVRRLAFSPDGSSIAVVRSTRPGTPSTTGADLKVYETATGRPRFAIDDQVSGISDAVFSPDGLRLASADGAGEVVIRESATGRPLLTVRGPTFPIQRIAFAADGQRLFGAGGRVDPLGLRDEESAELTIWDGRPLD